MKVVQCGKCGKEFPNMIKLSAHIRKKHGGLSVDAIVVDKGDGK